MRLNAPEDNKEEGAGDLAAKEISLDNCTLHLDHISDCFSG